MLCLKISYVAQTEVAGLSYKEEFLVPERGRNFDSIVIKLCT